MGEAPPRHAAGPHEEEVSAVKNMKNLTNELGFGAVARPSHAFTSGVFQGTAVPSAVRGTGILPGYGGTGLRLRARDLWIAPDSVPGGPVI